jgi:hypothetical protein
MALKDARFGLLRITTRDRIVVLHVTPIRHIARRGHMNASRRQFVAAVATVPFLPYAVAAQSRAQPSAPDPVLEQIVADLRELSAEFDAQPASRKATMRAMESTLGIGAAHLAVTFDPRFLTAIRRRSARQGRAALIQDVVNQAHARRNHNVAHDAVDAALTRLEQRGLSGCFRDVQQTIRKIRLQAPEQFQAAASRTMQFDYCADLNWMINMLEGIVAIVCAVAILEPTVGGEVACGAITLALGMLLVQRSLFC